MIAGISSAPAGNASVTMKRLPSMLPSLEARTVPPWASTSARTAASPMPRPTPLKPRACVSGAKGSKICGNACAVMPMPLSDTVNTAASSTSSSESRISPPSGVYLVALSSRLPTTVSSRARSPCRLTAAPGS